MSSMQNVELEDIPKKECVNKDLGNILSLKVDVEIINQNKAVGIKEGKIIHKIDEESKFSSLEKNKSENQIEFNQILHQNNEQNTNQLSESVRPNDKIQKNEKDDLIPGNERRWNNEAKEQNNCNDQRNELFRDRTKLENCRAAESNNSIEGNNNLTEQKISIFY